MHSLYQARVIQVGCVMACLTVYFRRVSHSLKYDKKVVPNRPISLLNSPQTINIPF